MMSLPYALHAKNINTWQVSDFAPGGFVFFVEPCGIRGLWLPLMIRAPASNGERGSTSYSTMARGRELYASKMNALNSIAVHLRMAI